MKPRIPTLLSLLIAFGAIIPCDARALPAKANAEEHRADKTTIVRVVDPRRSAGRGPSLLQSFSQLRGAHGIPVSLEWSFVESDRTNSPYPYAPFTIHKGGTLRNGLQRLASMSGGRLRLERIHDVLTFVPVRTEGTVESSLDTIVSLELEQVSTWEAFQELGKAVNRNRTNDRAFRVYPDFTDNLEPSPEEFIRPGAITLRLDNVTARNAICAIIQAAPIQISYRYANYFRPYLFQNSSPKSILRLYFFRDGRYYRLYGRLPPNEAQYWIDTVEAIKNVTPINLPPEPE